MLERRIVVDIILDLSLSFDAKVDIPILLLEKVELLV